MEPACELGLEIIVTKIDVDFNEIFLETCKRGEPRET